MIQKSLHWRFVSFTNRRIQIQEMILNSTEKIQVQILADSEKASDFQEATKEYERAKRILKLSWQKILFLFFGRGARKHPTPEIQTGNNQMSFSKILEDSRRFRVIQKIPIVSFGFWLLFQLFHCSFRFRSPSFTFLRLFSHFFFFRMDSAFQSSLSLRVRKAILGLRCSFLLFSFFFPSFFLL